MEVIAHRGNNREFYQNTRKSFEASVGCRADRIELDVHATRDNRLAVYHDFSFSGQKLAELTSLEIKNFTLPDGQKIPFLDEVVAEFLPHIELNIEIKGPSEKAASLVADLLQSSPLKKKVVVSSFFPEPLHVTKERLPELRIACLVGDDALFWPCFSHQSALVFMAETGAEIIHPRADLIDEAFVDQARSRGWKIYPWVPMAGEERGREELWALLDSFAVDGLCTNYPRELRSWLSTKSHVSERNFHGTLRQLAMDLSLELGSRV